MGIIKKLKSWFDTKKPELSSSEEYQSYTNQLNNQVTEQAENTTETGLSDGSDILNKTKDFMDNTIDEVKEQGEALWNEIKEKGAELNEFTKEYRDNLKKKTIESLKNIDEFVDDTVEKASALNKNKIDKDQDGFADEPIDFEKNSTGDQNDFFTKAEKWLERNDKVDSTNETNNFTEKIIHPVELPEDPVNPKS